MYSIQSMICYPASFTSLFSFSSLRALRRPCCAHAHHFCGDGLRRIQLQGEAVLCVRVVAQGALLGCRLSKRQSFTCCCLITYILCACLVVHEAHMCTCCCALQGACPWPTASPDALDPSYTDVGRVTGIQCPESVAEASGALPGHGAGGARGVADGRGTRGVPGPAHARVAAVRAVCGGRAGDRGFLHRHLLRRRHAAHPLVCAGAAGARAPRPLLPSDAC